MESSNHYRVVAVNVFLITSVALGFFALHGLLEAAFGVLFYALLTFSAELTMKYPGAPYLALIAPMWMYMLLLATVVVDAASLKAYICFSTLHASSRVLDLLPRNYTQQQQEGVSKWNMTQRMTHMMWLSDMRFVRPVKQSVDGTNTYRFVTGSLRVALIGVVAALLVAFYVYCHSTESEFLRKVHKLFTSVLVIQCIVLSLDPLYIISGAFANLIPEPVMNDPIFSARSLQEYWRRWNIPVSRNLKTYVYLPCRRQSLGPNIASLVTFVASGVYHMVAAVFAGCMAQVTVVVGVVFVVQAVGISIERLVFPGITKTRPLWGQVWLWGYSAVGFVVMMPLIADLL